MLALANLGVVQHGPTVLSSATEVSGHGERMKCMCHRKRAHRILVVDGDQAHFEQGLDALQLTNVRIVHPDGDCALVWEESVGKQSVCVEAGWGTGALACAESEGE